MGSTVRTLLHAKLSISGAPKNGCTISESAESEIRKKKIKAANPLAGQADVLLARHAILLPHQERVTNP